MKYIIDYTVPILKYKDRDPLFAISSNMNDNEIHTFLVTGHRYTYYTGGNILDYYIVETSIPVYVRDDMRWSDTISDSNINSEGGWRPGNASKIHDIYFIADSIEKVKELKTKHLNKFKEDLNKAFEELNGNLA